MIDGKVSNAITETSSFWRCSNIYKSRSINEEVLSFRISSLHARIRFLDYFLHIAYDLKYRKAPFPEYKTQALKKSRFILPHYGVFKGFWDWIILVSTFYVAILVPYNAAFAKADRQTMVSDVIVEALFIVDILLNFRTTFVSTKGEVVSDSKMIAINYLKGWFVVDLLAALPFDHLYASNLYNGEIFVIPFTFVRRVYISWMHALAERLKIPVSNITNAEAYSTALYFTFTSLTSVGFGNVSANTTAEKVFSIVMMLIGALMHAVVFGNCHCNYSTNMPKELKQRIEDYFQTSWSLNHGIDIYETLREFPEELRGDVSMHLHREILQLPIFEGASQGCLKLLSLHIKTNFCAPGEYLIHKGDALNYIYYLCNGSMEVIKDEMVVAILALSKEDKEKRLLWAKSLMDFGDKWEKVLFSDEKKFNLDGPDGFQYYWHDLRKDKEVRMSRNFGRGSLMIWGGFSIKGKLPLAWISTRMTSENYIEMLEISLIENGEDLMGNEFIFQQDNASLCTKDWFRSKNIEVLDWPARSPDLNPIENLWGIVARKVYANGKGDLVGSDINVHLVTTSNGQMTATTNMAGQDVVFQKN
ncbi:Potassium voltage-gated channel subfamily H member 3 [Lucilia cuprina]|nr:Potassium voltage-gated channel subfamily H member 3 [Lucilia cuprina]